MSGVQKSSFFSVIYVQLLVFLNHLSLSSTADTHCIPLLMIIVNRSHLLGRRARPVGAGKAIAWMMRCKNKHNNNKKKTWPDLSECRGRGDLTLLSSWYQSIVTQPRQQSVKWFKYREKRTQARTHTGTDIIKSTQSTSKAARLPVHMKLI